MSFAVVEDGHVVIKLRLDILKHVVETSNEVLPASLKVTDIDVFAKEVCYALNDECPDTGETMVHKMFDLAILEAVESGAEGCEIVDGVLDF